MTTPLVTAAAATLVAVLLSLPRQSPVAGPAWPAPSDPDRRRWRGPLLLAPAVVLAVLLVSSPRLAVLVGVVTGAGAGGARLLALKRARRAAVVTSARVLEACELLAAELAAGQPPSAALARAGVEWPVLAPVTAAVEMDADVPAALRTLARTAGAGDLRILAAAWQVSHRAGGGLAAAVDRVAHDLRAAHATRRVVQGELASARATARLIAALPLLALAMGSGAGGDPWGFLLGTPLGLACLAAGLALALTGLAWIEGIARGVESAR